MVPSSLIQIAEMLKWVALAVLLLNVAVILIRWAHW
jgi:hypothetical protein